MAVNDEFLDLVRQQMESIADLQFKKMFGGVGIFRDGLMFGVIKDETFSLKTDGENLEDFTSRGMTQWSPYKKGKGMPYWEVPHEVLENADELKIWAQKSFEAALRSKKK